MTKSTVIRLSDYQGDLGWLTDAVKQDGLREAREIYRVHGRGLVLKTIDPFTAREIKTENHAPGRQRAKGTRKVEYENRVYSQYVKLSDLLEGDDFDPAVVAAVKSYDPEREVVTMFQHRGFRRHQRRGRSCRFGRRGDPWGVTRTDPE